MSPHNNNSDTKAQKVKCFYRNKYEKWYWQLVNKRLNKPIKDKPEKHHIIPLFMDNNKDVNTEIVNLTRREHFIAHLLLLKMDLTPDNLSASSLNNFLKGYIKSDNNQTPTNLKKLWDKVQFKYDDFPDKPWEHSYRNNLDFLYVWSIADYLHYVWSVILLDNGRFGKGYTALAKATGLKPSKSLRRMVDAFRGNHKKAPSLCKKDGDRWIPNQDEDWLIFTNNFKI